MTATEFNEKYKDYLEEGFDGMEIDDEGVIKYMDEEFEKIIKVYPYFIYSQIKLKFGYSRVYTNLHELNKELDSRTLWEENINDIIKY